MGCAAHLDKNRKYDCLVSAIAYIPNYIASSFADVRGRFCEVRDRVQGFVGVGSEVGRCTGG
jgi:hypothetical protein